MFGCDWKPGNTRITMKVILAPVILFFALYGKLSSQELSLKNIKRNKTLIEVVNEDIHILSKKRRDQENYLYTDLLIDKNLKIYDSLEIAMPREYSLSSYALAEDISYYLFKSRNQLILFKSSEYGPILVKTINGKYKSKQKFYLYRKNEDLFILENNLKNYSHSIAKLDKEKNISWSVPIGKNQKNNSFLDIAITQQHVFAIFGDNAKSRKVIYYLRTIDSKTGDFFDTQLNYEHNANSIDLLKVIDNQLYLVGRTNQGKRINQNSVEKYYLAKFDVENKKFNYVLDDEFKVSNYKILWQDLVYKNGKLILIGESFGNTSVGASMAQGAAIAILSMGMITTTSPSTIKVKEVISTIVDDSFSEPKIITDLPVKSISLMHHLSSFYFAKYARSRGIFRYRGTNDLSIGLFKTSKGLYLIDFFQGKVINHLVPNELAYKIVDFNSSGLYYYLNGEYDKGIILRRLAIE